MRACEHVVVNSALKLSQALAFTILETASAVKGLPVLVRNPAWVRALETPRREQGIAAPIQTSLDSLFLDARIICLDGEVAVDVVVTPAEVEPGTWMLSDRLGRPLGTIAEASPSLFVLNADRHSELSRMRTTDFPSLNEAMSAIAKHMKGEYQLSSGNG
jgi:hypothetical protein